MTKWHPDYMTGHLSNALFVRNEREKHMHSSVPVTLKSPGAQPGLESDHGTADFQALCDPVTGLPNRTAVTEYLDLTIQSAEKNKTRFAVLFIDIDYMKDINDLYGHRIGDLLMQAVGKRLADCLRGTGLLARLGGDEFLVVLPKLATDNEASHIAAMLQSAISKDFHDIEGHEIQVSTTTGICMYPDGGNASVTLIKNAGFAMYQGKERGRRNYHFFSLDADPSQYSDGEVAHHLRKAIERQELHLHYQPRVDASSGEIVGAEALIRWHHPQMGSISPGRFIPLAEERGLIIEIGEWVLTEACRQNRRWQDMGLKAIPIGVNVSALQLTDRDFADKVANVLSSSGLAPQYLELELTESVVMRQPELVIATLCSLKALGLALSIDDFGTGYSSLSYLKKLPLDKLKLDQSFVRELPFEADNAAIVEAILLMAKALKLEVIAEGVETQAQLDFLRAHQCDEIQGFYFSKPLPANEFPRMLM
jgi:diguanylate cyclase (GGDEF)-like protein